jgi:topoisomerase-4 subunit A
VTKVDAKKFVGKDIIHAAVWKKGDKRTIYNLVYQDGTSGPSLVKRFAVTSITRDKEYDLTAGTKNSKVLYFSANPNGEAEVVHIKLRPRPSLKKLRLDFDFADLAIKGRAAKGNILTRNIVSKVEMKEKGSSTLAPRKIWFDDIVQRLNVDGRGTYLGQFSGSDQILTIYQKGYYRTTGFDLSTHFDEELIVIEKLKADKPVTAVYWEGEKGQFNVKRFIAEPAQKPVVFITEHEGSYLEFATTHPAPKVVLQFDKRSNDKEDEEIDLTEFISVKGVAAMGNRLTTLKIKAIDRIEPPVEEAPEEEIPELPEPEDGEVSDALAEDSDDQDEQKPDHGGIGQNGQATLF